MTTMALPRRASQRPRGPPRRRPFLEEPDDRTRWRCPPAARQQKTRSRTPSRRAAAASPPLPLLYTDAVRHAARGGPHTIAKHAEYCRRMRNRPAGFGGVLDRVVCAPIRRRRLISRRSRPVLQGEETLICAPSCPACLALPLRCRPESDRRTSVRRAASAVQSRVARRNPTRRVDCRGSASHAGPGAGTNREQD
jgi:hypothetical protein